ncbi:MAG: metal ABC transporter substrate-binding protein [Anaerolineae bacterium]
MRNAIRRLLTPIVLLSLLLTRCGAPGSNVESTGVQGVDVSSLVSAGLEDGERLRVVATTSIVADVVSRVGGDLIDLSGLMPLGVDPHAFEPTPQDAAAVSEAHVVFINGAGLELFIDDLLEAAGSETPVVAVSRGIDLLPAGAHDHEREEADADHEDEEHGEEEMDPHTWFDPNNVRVWVDNIEGALSRLDPDNAEAYGANARAYADDLDALDAWIKEQLAGVPEERRKLVTDHAVFTYFVEAYGFEQVGVIVPGASTLSEPSAQALADLVDEIKTEEIPAIFVSTTVNPRLAQQVARETGVEVVELYTGSLSPEGGPADTYLSFMRYDVTQIAEALR